MTITIFGGFHLIDNYAAFGNDDYWKWGEHLGKCNGQYAGQLDATDVLETRINHPFEAIEPGFFTEVNIITAFPDDYVDPNYSGPFEHFMIFMEVHPDPAPAGWQKPCLSPTDLNYYLSKFDQIKSLNQSAGGSQFKSVDVVYDHIFTEVSTVLLHKYRLAYGSFQPGNEQ
jgi:hypothetical protein